MMEVGVPDPNSPTTGTPPTNPPHDFPAVPEFSFYNYDHLGNTRVLYHNYFVSCTPGGTRYVLEHVLDYYPYGRSLREYTLTRDRFQTTYHERDQESGLDYRGARFYDGDIGSFLSCDPKAMDFAGWSTYNYVMGNPVKLIDPDGKEPTDRWRGIVHNNGTITYERINGQGGNQRDYIEYYREGKLPYSQINTESYMGEAALDVRFDPSGEMAHTFGEDLNKSPGRRGYSSSPALETTDGPVEWVLDLPKSIASLGASIFVVALRHETGDVAKFAVNRLEDLLENVAVEATRKGPLQGFIKGDGEAIFKAITKEGIPRPSGAFELPNGAFVSKHLKENGKLSMRWSDLAGHKSNLALCHEETTTTTTNNCKREPLAPQV